MVSAHNLRARCIELSFVSICLAAPVIIPIVLVVSIVAGIRFRRVVTSPHNAANHGSGRRTAEIPLHQHHQHAGLTAGDVTSATPTTSAAITSSSAGYVTSSSTLYYHLM